MMLSTGTESWVPVPKVWYRYYKPIFDHEGCVTPTLLESNKTIKLMGPK